MHSLHLKVCNKKLKRYLGFGFYPVREIRTPSMLKFSDMMRPTDEEQYETGKDFKWVGSFSLDHRPDETSPSSLVSLCYSYQFKSTPKTKINQNQNKPENSNSNNSDPPIRSAK